MNTPRFAPSRIPAGIATKARERTCAALLVACTSTAAERTSECAERHDLGAVGAEAYCSVRLKTCM